MSMSEQRRVDLKPALPPSALIYCQEKRTVSPLDLTFLSDQVFLGGRVPSRVCAATTCLLETAGDTHTHTHERGRGHVHCPVLTRSPATCTAACHQPITQTRTLRLYARTHHADGDVGVVPTRSVVSGEIMTALPFFPQTPQNKDVTFSHRPRWEPSPFSETTTARSSRPHLCPVLPTPPPPDPVLEGKPTRCLCPVVTSDTLGCSCPQCDTGC